MHGTWPNDSWWVIQSTATGTGHRSTLSLPTSISSPRTTLAESDRKSSASRSIPTVAEALRCGGKNLAVDAVLIIGEHGRYPKNEYGQTKYPRYQFFKQATDVFRQDGRAVPVFNDKHLPWRWEWAKEMVDLSREVKFPFLAGSSLPVTWRMPDVDMPLGCQG